MDELYMTYFGSQMIHPFMHQESAQDSDSGDATSAAVVSAMLERDAASNALGVRVRSVSPGTACVEMEVRTEMLNGHLTCHGGIIFTLADSAFAFASNSYNRTTVSSGCQISYIAPARLGDVLVATASELSRGRKTGIYDVHIVNQEGKTVALMRGNSYELRTSVIQQKEHPQ